MTITKKQDFVDLKFTGKANDEIFDSNNEEDLKKVNPDAKPEETIIVIGEGMVVPGLDEALEGKELEKDYEIIVPCKEGFGERKRELVRVIPLKAFTEQKVNPQTGMMLRLDNQVVKILAVSGARVTTDFNNPLASKELNYKFKITKLVTDEKKKVETLIKLYFRFLPDYEIKENEIVVKGPKGMDIFINAYKEKFKELIGKDLSFEEAKPKEKPETKE